MRIIYRHGGVDVMVSDSVSGNMHTPRNGERVRIGSSLYRVVEVTTVVPHTSPASSDVVVDMVAQDASVSRS
jgi:hypothetical protein